MFDQLNSVLQRIALNEEQCGNGACGAMPSVLAQGGRLVPSHPLLKLPHGQDEVTLFDGL